MKLVVSDPKKGRAYNLELDAKKEKLLIGLELGKTVDGSPLGLPGYKLLITGGSDKDGFPMRGDVVGRARTKPLLGGPPGFRPREEGLRRRKMVRGHIIVPEIVQVNAKVVEAGQVPLDSIFGQEVKEGAKEGAGEKAA